VASEEKVTKTKKKVKKRPKSTEDVPVEGAATTDEEPTPPPEEKPTLVITKPALHNPNAKKMVHCKVTDNVTVPGGRDGPITLIKGKKMPVPAAAVEDLRRSGCIH
jgi:hypothetical protein